MWPRRGELSCKVGRGFARPTIERVEFVARLRSTQKFAGVDALIEQMKKDVAETPRLVV